MLRIKELVTVDSLVSVVHFFKVGLFVKAIT